MVDRRESRPANGPGPAARRPGREAPPDPVPTVRARRRVRREGLAQSLALAAAVALLLHVAVILAFGGGAAMIRAALEDGIEGVDLGRLSEEIAGPGKALAVPGVKGG